MGSFKLTAEINARLGNIDSEILKLKNKITGQNFVVPLTISATAGKNIKDLNSAIAALNSNFGNLRSNAQTTATAVTNLNQGLKQSQVKTTQVATAANHAARASTRMTSSIRGTTDAVSEFGRVSGLALRRFVGFTVAAGAVFGFIRAVGGGIRAAISFERQLARIAQVTGTTVGSLTSLSAEVGRLAKAFGVDSAKLIEVSQVLAQAGMNAREVKIAIGALTKTTLAPTFGDITQTTEGAISIMNQFKLTAKDLESVFGAMNAVAAKFPVETDNIVQAVRRAGSTFAMASAGIGDAKTQLNEFMALFTAVRSTTRESSETIATGLRTIFARLQRPGTVKRLEGEFGLSLTDKTTGQFIGIYKAVEKISQALATLPQRSTKLAEMVEVLGGVRRMQQVIPLFTEINARVEAFKTAQEGSASINEDAEKALKTMSVRLQQVSENFKNLIREISNTTTFRLMIDAIIGLSNAFTELARSVKPIIPVLALLMGAKGLSAIPRLFKGFGRGAGGYGTWRTGSYNTGGTIPGSGSGDKMLIRAEPGEFMIKKKSVEKIGIDLLRYINKHGKLPTGYIEGDSIGKDIKFQGVPGQVSGLGKPYIPESYILNALKRVEVERRKQERTDEKLAESNKKLDKSLANLSRSLNQVKQAEEKQIREQRAAISRMKQEPASIGGVLSQPLVTIPFTSQDILSKRKSLLSTGMMQSILLEQQKKELRYIESQQKFSPIGVVPTTGPKGVTYQGPLPYHARLFQPPRPGDPMAPYTPYTPYTYATAKQQLPPTVMPGATSKAERDAWKRDNRRLFGGINRPSDPSWKYGLGFSPQPWWRRPGFGRGGIGQGITKFGTSLQVLGFMGLLGGAYIKENQLFGKGRAGTGISGGLAGGLGGAFFGGMLGGAKFGPQGAIIGAFIGSVNGITNSLNEFDKALDAKKVEIAIDQLEKALQSESLINVLQKIENLGYITSKQEEKIKLGTGAGAISSALTFAHFFGKGATAEERGLVAKTGVLPLALAGIADIFDFTSSGKHQDDLLDKTIEDIKIEKSAVKKPMEGGILFVFRKAFEKGVDLNQAIEDNRELYKDLTTIHLGNAAQARRVLKAELESIQIRKNLADVTNSINDQFSFLLKNFNDLSAQIKTVSEVGRFSRAKSSFFGALAEERHEFFRTEPINVFENARGQSREALLGGVQRLEGFFGESPKLAELRTAVGAYKDIQDVLPQRLEQAFQKYGMDLTNIREGEITEGGVAKPLDNIIRDILLDLPGVKQSPKFLQEEMADALINMLTKGEAIIASRLASSETYDEMGEKVGELWATAIEKTAKDLTDLMNQINGALDDAYSTRLQHEIEFNNRLADLSGARAERELELRQALTLRDMTLGELNAPHMARLGVLGGGRTSERIIADVEGRVAQIVEKGGMLARGEGVANELRGEIKDLTAANAKDYEALKFLATSMAPLTNALNKLRESQEKREQQRAFLDKVTGGPSEIIQLNRQMAAFAKFQTGQPMTNLDYATAKEATQTFGFIFGKDVAEKILAGINRQQIESMAMLLPPDQRDIFRGAFAEAGKPFGESDTELALAEEYRLASEAMNKAADALNSVATKFSTEALSEAIRAASSQVVEAKGLLYPGAEPAASGLGGISDVSKNVKRFDEYGFEMASGGVFRGRPGVDTNPAMLTAGEYIMPKEVTAKTLPLLEMIRKSKGRIGYVDGGIVNRQFTNDYDREQFIKKTIIEAQKYKVKNIHQRNLEELGQVPFSGGGGKNIWGRVNEIMTLPEFNAQIPVNKLQLPIEIEEFWQKEIQLEQKRRAKQSREQRTKAFYQDLASRGRIEPNRAERENAANVDFANRVREAVQFKKDEILRRQVATGILPEDKALDKIMLDRDIHGEMPFDYTKKELGERQNLQKYIKRNIPTSQKIKHIERIKASASNLPETKKLFEKFGDLGPRKSMEDVIKGAPSMDKNAQIALIKASQLPFNEKIRRIEEIRGSEVLGKPEGESTRTIERALPGKPLDYSGRVGLFLEYNKRSGYGKDGITKQDANISVETLRLRRENELKRQIALKRKSDKASIVGVGSRGIRKLGNLGGFGGFGMGLGAQRAIPFIPPADGGFRAIHPEDDLPADIKASIGVAPPVVSPSTPPVIPSTKSLPTLQELQEEFDLYSTSIPKPPTTVPKDYEEEWKKAYTEKNKSRGIKNIHQRRLEELGQVPFTGGGKNTWGRVNEIMTSPEFGGVGQRGNIGAAGVAGAAGIGPPSFGLQNHLANAKSAGERFRSTGGIDTKGLNDFNAKFNENITTLGTHIETLNNAITSLQGLKIEANVTGTVEVHITGATWMDAIGPKVQEMINTSVENALQQSMDNRTGETKSRTPTRPIGSRLASSPSMMGD